MKGAIITLAGAALLLSGCINSLDHNHTFIPSTEKFTTPAAMPPSAVPVYKELVMRAIAKNDTSLCRQAFRDYRNDCIYQVAYYSNSPQACVDYLTTINSTTSLNDGQIQEIVSCIFILSSENNRDRMKDCPVALQWMQSDDVQYVDSCLDFLISSSKAPQLCQGFARHSPQYYQYLNNKYGLSYYQPNFTSAECYLKLAQTTSNPAYCDNALELNPDANTGEYPICQPQAAQQPEGGGVTSDGSAWQINQLPISPIPGMKITWLQKDLKLKVNEMSTLVFNITNIEPGIIRRVKWSFSGGQLVITTPDGRTIGQAPNPVLQIDGTLQTPVDIETGQSVISGIQFSCPEATNYFVDIASRGVFNNSYVDGKSDELNVNCT